MTGLLGVSILSYAGLCQESHVNVVSLGLYGSLWQLVLRNFSFLHWGFHFLRGHARQKENRVNRWHIVVPNWLIVIS